jgi:hypothetical protein
MFLVTSARPSQCRRCSHKPACTPPTHRTLKINWHEDIVLKSLFAAPNPAASEYHLPKWAAQLAIWVAVWFFGGYFRVLVGYPVSQQYKNRGF